MWIRHWRRTVHSSTERRSCGWAKQKWWKVMVVKLADDFFDFYGKKESSLCGISFVCNFFPGCDPKVWHAHHYGWGRGARDDASKIQHAAASGYQAVAYVMSGMYGSLREIGHLESDFFDAAVPCNFWRKMCGGNFAVGLTIWVKGWWAFFQKTSYGSHPTCRVFPTKVALVPSLSSCSSSSLASWWSCWMCFDQDGYRYRRNQHIWQVGVEGFWWP